MRQLVLAKLAEDEWEYFDAAVIHTRRHRHHLVNRIHPYLHRLLRRHFLPFHFIPQLFADKTH